MFALKPVTRAVIEPSPRSGFQAKRCESLTSWKPKPAPVSEAVVAPNVWLPAAAASPRFCVVQDPPTAISGEAVPVPPGARASTRTVSARTVEPSVAVTVN